MKQRLVLLPLAVLLLFLSHACDSLPKRGTDEASVSIGQPTVYMRERSLIERFEDLEWLRLQRGADKEKEYEQGFQGSATTATAEKTGFALKAAIGKVLAEKESPPAPPPLDSTPVEVAGPPATAPGTAGTAATTSETPPADGSAPAGDATDGAKEGEKKEEKSSDLDTFLKLDELDSAALGKAFAELNAAEPTLSPRDKLVNRLAFRDTVAEAIRQRSLDDVHDLEGMALYEIQFDLSIVGGEDSGQAYAVMVQVVPPDECKEKEAIRDMVRPILQALRAACLAEIEETRVRYSDGRLTAHDSPYLEEAELRGVLAARHEELMDVRARMEMAEQAVLDVWAALEQRTDLSEQQRKDLDALGRRPQSPSIPCLAKAWCVLDARQESPRSFREKLLAGPTQTILRASESLELFFLACEGHLATIARRQAVLRGLARKVHEAPEQEGAEDSLMSDQIQLWSQDAKRVVEGDDGARPLSASPTAIGSSSGAARSSADDARLKDLIGRLENRALEEREGFELGALIREPSQASISQYTLAALGFVIARAHAEGSGGALTYQEIAPNGLDARALLPVLLKDEPDSTRWALWAQRMPRIVSVTPTEVAEQITASAQSEIEMAFSLALQGVFRGTVADATAAFDRVSKELRRYELIERNPLLVGFVGGNTDEGIASNSFGWILGPRLQTSTSGKATLRYRQISSHHPVTATLVAPAGLPELDLCYQTFRISDTGEWLEARAVPTPSEKMRKLEFPQGVRPAFRNKGHITIDLPVNPELIAHAMSARQRWSASLPRVLAGRSTRPDETPDHRDGVTSALWHLQAGKEKQAFAILGSNLWRNPQVYVGGQRATRVQILPDLGGLWAEFEGVHAPPGQDGKPERVDLLVSTSRGSDRIQGGVEILPLKAEAKPPEPKLVPPLQVVVPKISKGGDVEESKATVDLRFALTPPLPKAWSELQIRVRQKQAAAVLLETKVEPSWLFADPEVPGGFQIRGLEITKKSAWGKIERLEVTLQLRESPVADLRSLHPTPVEVVLVRQPIACTSDQKLVVEKRESDGKWLLAAETTVVLKQEEPLEPALLALLAPKLEVGKLVPAQATIEGQGTAKAQLRAEREAVGKLWSVVLPAGVVCGAPDKAAKIEISLDEGAPKLGVSLQLEPKEEKPKEEEKKKDK